MFFQINADNTIAGFDSQEQAAAVAAAEAVTFQTSKELTAIGMAWPISKLEGVWNGLAGQDGIFKDLKPVRKFENKQIAIVRIWGALQRLNGHTGEKLGGHEPDTLPPPESATKIAAAKPGANRVRKQPKGAKTPKEKAANKPAKTPKAPKADKPKAERKPKTEDGSSKKATVIDMMKRKGGATLDEIMNATGWQPHTTRGFVSILQSKHGLKIESTRREEDKARVYKVID